MEPVSQLFNNTLLIPCFEHFLKSVKKANTCTLLNITSNFYIILLNIKFLRFSQIVVWSSSSFFLMAALSFTCDCTTVYPLSRWWPFGFPHFPLMNSAAISITVHVSCCMCARISLMYILGSGIAGLWYVDVQLKEIMSNWFTVYISKDIYKRSYEYNEYRFQHIVLSDWNILAKWV